MIDETRVNRSRNRQIHGSMELGLIDPGIGGSMGREKLMHWTFGSKDPDFRLILAFSRNSKSKGSSRGSSLAANVVVQDLR